MKKVYLKIDNKKSKETSVKNWTYYYLNGLVNVNDHHLKNIAGAEKLFKDNFIHYFRYKIPYKSNFFVLFFIK